jgi:hypothetical protein
MGTTDPGNPPEPTWHKFILREMDHNNNPLPVPDSPPWEYYWVTCKNHDSKHCCQGIIAPTISASQLGTTPVPTIYYYILTATTTSGESNPSKEVQVMNGYPTLSPLNPITVKWTPVPNATGYKLYRTLAGGAQGSEQLLATINDGLTASYADDGSAFPDWNPPAVSSAPSLSPPTNLKASPGSTTTGSTTYRYVVTATATLTATVTGETLASTPEAIVTNFVAELSVADPINVSWNPVTGATGYKLYRTVAGGASGSEQFLATISGGSTVTYTDDGSASPALWNPPDSHVNTAGCVYYETSVRFKKQSQDVVYITDFKCKCINP